jgi:hypothetical protein
VLAAIGAGAIATGLLLGALVRLSETPDPGDALGVARTSSPSATPTATSEAAPSASRAAPPSVEARPPNDPPGPDPSPLANLVPVKGPGRQIGGNVLMAAGRDGELYVGIPTGTGEVLTLLDRDGRPRPGWPIPVPGNDFCGLLLAAPDGSVRVLCDRSETVDGLDAYITQAHAFGRDGKVLPGWPADLSAAFTGVMVGDALVVLSREYVDAPEENAPEYVHMDVVGADGAMRSGVDVAFPCCDSAFALSPHRMGIVSTREWSESGDSVTTTLVAFDESGIRDGWPITIDGNTSEVAFDRRGAAHLVVSAPYEPPSRTIVLGADGRRLGGSGDLDIVSSLTSEGAGDSYPAAPIVASDMSTFIVSTEDGRTTIMGLDPGGRPLDGWPYRSKLGIEFINQCVDTGDTGCSSPRTAMGVDAHDVLYLIHGAASPSAGGSVMAIGPDGRVRDGWPVGLRRAGSVFWALAVNPDGGAYALAIEPEGDSHSATIVAITDDSTVRYTKTIVEP